MRRPTVYAAGGLLALAGACSKDESGYSVSGQVLALDDETPVVGAMVIAPGNKRALTDSSGRFQISDVRGQGALSVSAARYAPVQKPVGGGTGALSMKRIDGSATITKQGGGAVRDVARHAAVRFPAGGLAGSDDREVVLAAPDPRQPRSMKAVTGAFTARRAGRAGRMSAISPLYVAAGDGTRSLLAANSKVEIDFPAWVQGRASQSALFAFDESSGDWTEVGTVTAATDDSGEPVYRAESDQLGWLAIGEFYTDLSCVKGCISGEERARIEVAATGVDHFSQTVTQTDRAGCFQLEVRANAQVRIEMAAAAGIQTLKVVDTGAAGASCSDLGSLGGGTEQSGRDVLIQYLRSCNVSGSDAALGRIVTGNLGDELLVIPDALRESYERALSTTAACIAALPCATALAYVCQGQRPTDADLDALDRCMEPLESEDGGTTPPLSCDGKTLDPDQICDGYRDCTGGQDETSAICATGVHYRCADGTAISPDSLCDGERQCPAGDDEQTACVVCANGDVLSRSAACNGRRDCEGGEDESSCDPWSCPPPYDVCRPETCETGGYECGLAPDGCGGVLSCGTCQESYVCGLQEPNRCGSVAPDGEVVLVPNKVTNVGATCSSSGVCTGVGPTVCLQESIYYLPYAEGYCSANCLADVECGPSGICPVAEASLEGKPLPIGTQECYRACASEAECRTGYGCTVFRDVLIAAYTRFGYPVSLIPDARSFDRRICAPRAYTSDAGVSADVAMGNRDAGTASGPRTLLPPRTWLGSRR